MDAKGESVPTVAEKVGTREAEKEGAKAWALPTVAENSAFEAQMYG